MSSLLVFNRVSGDKVSHVGIFDPALRSIASLTFSLVHFTQPSPPPFPKSKYSTVYTDSVWLGGGGVVLSFVGDHILQEF